MNLKQIYKYGSPPNYFKLSLKAENWFLIPGFVLIIIGCLGGLFIAPPDSVSYTHLTLPTICSE